MSGGPTMKMEKKMAFVLFVVFFAGFAVLIGRLAKLQFVDGESYQKHAISQQLSVKTIYANRGTIYDRNMKPLAQSATVWDVYISPAYIKGRKQKSAIADNLSRILDIDRKTVYDKISMKTSYVVIKKKIEKPTADLVEKYIDDNNLKGVGLLEDSKRYYPFGAFASQVLGFTGTDNQGLAGVEAEYDDVLRGVNGKVVTAKNARGTEMPIDFENRMKPQSGRNVVLTIDEVVQHYLEENIENAYLDDSVGDHVTGIVMDVKTGAILGMATKPDFDPNDPFTVSDASVKSRLGSLSGKSLKDALANARQNMWRNKAITDPYEPGSTFKIITTASALDAGVVKESDRFFDGGSINVDGTTFHCWKHGGHGAENFLEGFENSCNVVFIQVGQRLGAQKFFKYFSSFGLAGKTDIDLPGEADSIYYKANKLGSVELASCSFGQSNKITPIQLVTAVSAVVNGGVLPQPHLVEKETDNGGNVVKVFPTGGKGRAISQNISKEVSNMMQMEVQSGTGKNAYVPGYRIGGKTGTSQKLDEPHSQNVIASFVGIAPADDPQIAILLLIDSPHSQSTFGGVIAAPVVGNVFSEILPYLGIKTKYTPEETEKLEAETPDLVGKSASDAANELNGSGLTLRTIGSGGTVTDQVPDKGEPIPKGGTVIAYLGKTPSQEPVTVPDVKGKAPADVNAEIVNSGLNIQFSGNVTDRAGTTAYGQDPAAGSKVSPGTVVTVQFRDENIKVR